MAKARARVSFQRKKSYISRGRQAWRKSLPLSLALSLSVCVSLCLSFYAFYIEKFAIVCCHMIYMADLAKRRQRRVPRRIATCHRWKWALLLLAVFVKFVKCPCVSSFVKFVMSIRFAKPYGERLTICFVAQREISIKTKWNVATGGNWFKWFIGSKEKMCSVCESVCVCEFASKRRCMIKKNAVFSRLKLHSPSCCGATVEGSEKKPRKKAERKL